MMKSIFGVAAGLLLFCGAAQARDSFDAIRCGADIPKLLIGKVMPADICVHADAEHIAVRAHLAAAGGFGFGDDRPHR